MAKFRLPVRKVRIGLTNLLKRRQRLAPYLLMSLHGAIDELPQPRPRIPFGRFVLPPEPQTVSSLRRQFEQLALDPRVLGVVLKIECSASAATYQSLHQLLLDFRSRGKRLVAYANSFGPFQYYLAAACDQVIMPPGAEWGITGLLREYVFFKDALDQLGIGIDVVNVSPFKSAFDQFKRSDFSEESRAQAEWLLDATYNELVHGIAEGRKLDETRVRELIDSAPVGARAAVELGLLDAVLYEDELEAYLTPAAKNDTIPANEASAGKRIRAKQPVRQAQLALYDDTRRGLLVPYFERAARRIGVVTVEGTIVEGRSQSLPLPLPVPFFGNQFAGAESIVQALRQAGDDEAIAAIILYVDSGGGSALASDLIAREVRRVREIKPVVAYMSGVAASGGYYVAALAHSIIAQPLTITGSIGVIAMKPNVQAAQSKLFLHNTPLQRGAHAGMYSIATP
ncbi:MAG TPA: S49 family peptidase, partial [Anaerolineae bacterium]